MNSPKAKQNNTTLYIIIGVAVLCCCCIISSISGGFAALGIGGSPSPSPPSDPKKDAPKQDAPKQDAPKQGTSEVKHNKSGNCLDSNGKELYMGGCHGGEFQKWNF